MGRSGTNPDWEPRAIGRYSHIGAGTNGERKYRKDSGNTWEIMYQWTDNTWRIGQHEQYDPGYVRSRASALCPEDIRQWQFFDRENRFDYVNGEITVQCVNLIGTH